MIDGKVADPEDYFHQFMLNGYGYLGMKRMGEVFEAIGAEEAESLQKEAADWRNDIRESLERTMALSPVVPLGDGTWSPTAPPWTEASGTAPAVPTGRMFPPHGTFTVPDAMLGPMYLVLRGNRPGRARFGSVVEISQRTDVPGKFDFQPTVLQPSQLVASEKGMVKPFLSTYYHTMAPTPIREPIRSGSISTN